MTVLRWRAGPRTLLFGVLLALPTLQTKGVAQDVDWAALNPTFRGAEYVRDAQVCEGCHEKTEHRFDGTSHARMFRSGKAPAQGECESCHGPRSKHVDNPGKGLEWTALSTAGQSKVCMQCHEGGDRMSWKSGTHLAADVSCTSCHNPKEPSEQVGMLKPKAMAEKCYGCHGEVRAQMSKASHHPVREGRMECSSCHNVHGSAPQLLVAATVNEVCAGCHTEKRGPFVWEHAPVVESCANCHDAHGSTNRQLLNKKDAFLCLQCHSYGGHINLPRYNRTSNPYGQGCVNCHMTVHGSNHPSGAKLTR